MSLRYSGYGPRGPRHPGAGVASCRVEAERSADREPGLIQAELVDLSRDGYQLRTCVPLAKGESVTLRLHDKNSGLRLALPGTVRWTRSKSDSAWLSGCQASCELDWETLGELFLHGILATDGP